MNLRMNLRMSVRDRRALSIGAAAILGLILLGRGLPALLSWERKEATRAQAQGAELARARVEIARARAVQDSAREHGARIVALAPLLLGGDSPATATATLAGIVSGAAARANVRVGALQLHADTASKSTFVRVGVRGEVTGDIAGVTAMLASLERGPTMLAIRELSITQPEPAAASDHMEALHVELVVEGLMQRPLNEAFDKGSP
jgi:hypothetical protein